VRDTGIGMAPEAIPLALEPFRQIASPFARNAEGSGLGFSLVKSLIECHGGTLELESTPNCGTTARLILPAARCIAKRNALSA
jgi:two-component system, cell cycle sensor histidine kinase PleC